MGLAAGNAERRTRELLGDDFMAHARAVDVASGALRLSGFAALPAYARATRDAQYFYVNGRFVRDKLIQHYPTYSQYLRPDAATHVVVVTDDNAGMNPNTFDTMFKALEPGMADYKFHAICGKNDVDDFLWCAQNPACCAFTAEAGDVYLDLIALTGGKWGDLCLQNFTPVFNELSTQVVMGATLACEWTIPEPMGEPIDFNKVNVEFDDGVPPNDVFGKVADPADCANVSDGWYYDNPQMPTKIFVCPQTCTKIQGVDNAKINIQFGCETIIAQ